MTLRWLRAWRELSCQPRRTWLVVVALALGVWGFGSVAVTRTILLRDLAANFERTLPPHVVLRSSHFGPRELGVVSAEPGVEAAELRDFSIHRVEVRPGHWIPLYLFGVDDPHGAGVARLTWQAGAVRPPPGTVLLERDLRHISGLNVGSQVRARFGARIATLHVSGLVHDAAQAPATQDAFAYAYCDHATYLKLTGRPLGQRMVIRLRGAPFGQQIRHAAGVLLGNVEQAGVRVSSVEYPVQAHPHQWQLDTLLELVGALAGLSLLLAGVIVATLSATLMAEQVRQIGVLKAIGASRVQVLQIYGLVLLMLGAGAAILATPLAFVSGTAFAHFVARKLNFDVLAGAGSRVYLALGIGGLLLPLGASMPALLRATGISTKDALAGTSLPRRNAIPTSVLALTWLPVQLRLACRTVLLHRKSLLFAVLSLGLGVATFQTGFNVRASLWRMLQGVDRELGYDVQVTLAAPTARAQALAPFASLKNVQAVELWSGGQGAVHSKLLTTSKGVGVIALPPRTDFFKPSVSAGRWLHDSDRPEVVLNQQAAAAYGNPRLGELIRVAIDGRVQDFVLVGTVQQFDVSKLYISARHYARAFDVRARASTVLLRAEKHGLDEVLALKRSVEEALAASDLEVVTVVSHRERLQSIYEHLNVILTVLVLLSVLVLVVSALGNASLANTRMLQRTRELGVLRALGATPARLRRLYALEGAVFGPLGLLIGVALSVPLTDLASARFGQLMLGPGMRLPAAFSPLGLGFATAATLVFGAWSTSSALRAALRTALPEALSVE